MNKTIKKLQKFTKDNEMKYVSLALLCALALGLTTHLQARVFNDEYADERPYRYGPVSEAVHGSAEIAGGAVDTASHAVSDTLHTIF